MLALPGCKNGFGRDGPGVNFVVDTKFTEGTDEARGPPVDIVFLDGSAHAAHPSDHFVGIHLECLGD